MRMRLLHRVSWKRKSTDPTLNSQARAGMHISICVLEKCLKRGVTCVQKNIGFVLWSTHAFSFYVLNSLKLECEKLASEKTEMQRHYVMVSKLLNKFKMSIGLVYWDRNTFELLEANRKIIVALLLLRLHQCFHYKFLVSGVFNLFVAVSFSAKPASAFVSNWGCFFRILPDNLSAL